MRDIRHPDPPDETDIRLVDGVFMKMMRFRHAGMLMGQHSHCYDHISFIASGAVRVFADDRLLGEFVAPTPVVIKAQVAHRFETLTPDVTVLCIHNADRAEHGEDVAIMAEA